MLDKGSNTHQLKCIHKQVFALQEDVEHEVNSICFFQKCGATRT
jgi:hypothetical protein